MRTPHPYTMPASVARRPIPRLGRCYQRHPQSASCGDYPDEHHGLHAAISGQGRVLGRSAQASNTGLLQPSRLDLFA